MPYYLRNDFLQTAPFFLAAAEKQYLIGPDPRGGLQMQEGVDPAWDEPFTLPGRPQGYSAAVDEEGALHLVFVEQGHFYHLIAPSKRKTEAPAPFYREEGKECRHLLMSGAREGGLHLISAVFDLPAGRWWLLHHRYSGGAWQEARVIDFGKGDGENCGTLALDESGCLHYIYRFIDPGSATLRYRKFDRRSARWSEAVPIPVSAPASFPSLAIDGEQNLHLLWSAAAAGKHYICYRFKGGPGGKRQVWTPEAVISPAMETAPFPFFTYRSAELFIAWLENDSLSRFRFAGNQWEGAAPEQLKKAQLFRASYFGLERQPLHYWSAVENDEAVPAAILPAAGYHDLGSDLFRLQRYSGKLFSRLADLSTARDQLEEKIKARERSMLLLSRQGEKKMRLLQDDLELKDKELQELKQDFERVVDSLKKKSEQSLQSAAAERKRFMRALEEHKQERRRFERTLQEKETLIARLEKRCREQRLLINELERERAALKPKARVKRQNLRGLWEGLFRKKL